MKRVLTFVGALLIGASLALAQTGGDKKGTELNPQPLPPGIKQPETAKTTTHSKKKGAHKGGKKSKKGSTSGSASTTTPPK